MMLIFCCVLFGGGVLGFFSSLAALDTADIDGKCLSAGR